MSMGTEYGRDVAQSQRHTCEQGSSVLNLIPIRLAVEVTSKPLHFLGLHPLRDRILLQLEQTQNSRTSFLGNKRHRFLVSRLQKGKLHVQRRVVGDPPRGIEPMKIQRAEGFPCEVWHSEDREFLKSMFTEVDAVVEDASLLRFLDFFEWWPWSAVD